MVSMAPNNMHRYVVTGPSGWIGRTLLARLASELGDAIGAKVIAFASSARSQSLSPTQSMEVRALETLAPTDVAGAHLIHLAYLTKEKAEQLGERSFTETNLAIDDAVLTAISSAATAGAAPASIFVASSGAAGMAIAGRSLHPYGLGKLRQEARFLEIAARFDIPTIAGRIFNLSGPNINKLSSYAISDFALQALESGNIMISSEIPVFRSFLHVEDLCALIAGAAHQGMGAARPVDLCGSEIVEMEDLAAAVVRAVGGNRTIGRGPVDWSDTNAYIGDFVQTKMLAMQLDIPLAGFERQVQDTVDWIRGRIPKKMIDMVNFA